MKQAFYFIFAIVIFFFAAQQIQAGGCCFSQLQQETVIPIVGDRGVMLKSRLHNIEYFSVSQSEPEYKANEKVEAKIIHPIEGQYCEAGTTDTNGYVSIRCYSTIYSGPMEVYFETPNYKRETGELYATYPLKIMFTGGKDRGTAVITPVLSPTIESAPAGTTAQTTVGLNEKVASLEQKIEIQNERIGFLEQIIARLQEMFAGLFN